MTLNSDFYDEDCLRDKINPPCDMCFERVECDVCGQFVCSHRAEIITDMSDGNKIALCPECSKEELV